VGENVTLAPSTDFGIVGHPGNRYDVSEICVVPGCGQRAVHVHHCWARSYLKKDYEWVIMSDGTILGNRVGVCLKHHEWLTGGIGGHRARLAWDHGLLWWETRIIDTAGAFDWFRQGPIDPQPPIAGRHDHRAHALMDDGDTCPTCGHVKHPPAEPGTPKPGKRPSKEWTVTCPQDAEIGAAVLDEWIDDFAIPLGFSDASSRLKRYHVLAVVLAWASQHRGEFIRDISEAAGRRVA
jgi:hypothetical protein